MLQREADAAFQRNDIRSGQQVLGQIVAVAPGDSTSWLRIARTVLRIRPGSDDERASLLERAATAAYLAYQRSGNGGEEADSLVLLARTYADRSIWRPALDALRISLDLREVAEVRQQYERLREEHGFRLLDYTVDADSASPRVCFQFSEDLPGRRTDFSPFVTVAGQDKPALSVQDRQLCVEGLRHGERYAVTLRAGIPSVVKETLSRSADYSVYVRDRKPSVRFAGKAYVLPRTGQRGIPVVSVNTTAVMIEIYRIGDRNLLGSVIGRDFQSSLDHWDLERLAAQRGMQVWKGEMAVEQTLNTDVTTAFPVDQAIGTPVPGIYVMVGQPAGATKDEYEALATQWFIVSDIGLTAFSGNDGIHAFVHSLDTARPKGAIEIRLMSRGNEILARKRSSGAGYVHFEANLTRRGGSIVARDADRRRGRGRLRVPEPEGAGLRSQRPRGLRSHGAGWSRRIRLCRARRLPLGRDGAGDGAAARCSRHRRARPAAHAGGGTARRRRIPPQRRRRPGPGRTLACGRAGAHGADRHLAGVCLRRSQGATGRRGYLHGRGLCARPARTRSRQRCRLGLPIGRCGDHR